jgi:carbonic anhydrase
MPAPTCTHVVLACMDFRFVETLRRFLDAEGITGDADLLTWPGGAACLALDEERDRALTALALATRLHGCERVLLVAHEDCMRLGGSAAYADPTAEADALADHLRRAADEVRASIPALQPRTVVLRSSGDVIDVELD